MLQKRVATRPINPIDPTNVLVLLCKHLAAAALRKRWRSLLDAALWYRFKPHHGGEGVKVSLLGTSDALHAAINAAMAE